MKKAKENGFILMVIIVQIASAAMFVLVLSASTNSMIYQTNTAYIKACQENLSASGLAWAKGSIRKNGGKIFGQTIEIDVLKMDLAHSSLNVNIQRGEGKTANIVIDSSVSAGRQKSNRSNRYVIEN